MALLALLSLFCYVASLAIALTWYGAGLMNLRWFALSAVLITSTFYWAFSKQDKFYQWEKNDNMIVLVYLILTFLSVIAAENPLFSGLRWVSHGLMILTLLILLKNSLTLDQAAGILLFLKAVISVLLLVSWLKPPSTVKVGGGLLAYAGVFGSSNALGQVAAVGTILYLHGFLTDKAKWMRVGQVGMSGLALWIMWLTGSRSAFVAFLAGLAMMYYFYPKLVRGKIFVAVLLVASMGIAAPGIPGKIQHVILRSSKPVENVSEQLLITRKSVWEAGWTGFQKRPLLGWGFGAASGIPKEWKVELKALGTVNRDAVNDTLFVLEGGSDAPIRQVGRGVFLGRPAGHQAGRAGHHQTNEHTKESHSHKSVHSLRNGRGSRPTTPAALFCISSQSTIFFCATRLLLSRGSSPQPRPPTG